MMRNTLLLSTMLLTFTCSHASHIPVDQILGTAKNYLAVGKKVFEKIEEIVNSSKIVDGKLVISGLKASVDIQDIDTFIDYLQENPTIASVIRGTLQQEQTKLAQATRIYTGISAEKLHLIQGIALGVMGTQFITFASNALMPSTICSVLPAGAAAFFTAGCTALGIYLVYKYMPIPQTITERVLYKATHLATHIAPYIGTGLAGSVKVAQEKDNTKLTQLIFTDLRSTLTITQKKLLSQRHVLLCAYFKPELLRHEILFLNALNKNQVDKIACLFEACASSYKSQLFDRFADTLTAGQISKLKPDNKLLIALFNPAILQPAYNEEFLKSLTSSQTEQLLAAIKQAENS